MRKKKKMIVSLLEQTKVEQLTESAFPQIVGVLLTILFKVYLAKHDIQTVVKANVFEFFAIGVQLDDHHAAPIYSNASDFL